MVYYAYMTKKSDYSYIPLPQKQLHRNILQNYSLVPNKHHKVYSESSYRDILFEQSVWQVEGYMCRDIIFEESIGQVDDQ